MIHSFPIPVAEPKMFEAGASGKAKAKTEAGEPGRFRESFEGRMEEGSEGKPVVGLPGKTPLLPGKVSSHKTVADLKAGLTRFQSWSAPGPKGLPFAQRKTSVTSGSNPRNLAGSGNGEASVTRRRELTEVHPAPGETVGVRISQVLPPKLVDPVAVSGKADPPPVPTKEIVPSAQEAPSRPPHMVTHTTAPEKPITQPKQSISTAPVSTGTRQMVPDGPMAPARKEGTPATAIAAVGKTSVPDQVVGKPDERMVERDTSSTLRASSSLLMRAKPAAKNVVGAAPETGQETFRPALDAGLFVTSQSSALVPARFFSEGAKAFVAAGSAVVQAIPEAGELRPVGPKRTSTASSEIKKVPVVSSSHAEGPAVTSTATMAMTIHGPQGTSMPAAQEAHPPALAPPVVTPGGTQLIPSVTGVPGHAVVPPLPLSVAGEEGRAMPRGEGEAFGMSEPRTLVSTPNVLEVGFGAGLHGWLRVRAELDQSGGVAASLAASSLSAATSLTKELGALGEYLKNESVGVISLAVSLPEKHAALATADHGGSFGASSDPASGGSNRGGNREPRPESGEKVWDEAALARGPLSSDLNLRKLDPSPGEGWLSVRV